MLTTAQKHDLIIKFNQDRQQTFEDYQVEKMARKEEEEKSGTAKAKSGSQYTKLYKHLGADNRNKDVRRQL